MNGLRILRRGVIAGIGSTVLLPRAPAFAQGVTLDKIKKGGELRVGCEAAYVPFTYRDRSGSIVGRTPMILPRDVGRPVGGHPHTTTARRRAASSGR